MDYTTKETVCIQAITVHLVPTSDVQYYPSHGRLLITGSYGRIIKIRYKLNNKPLNIYKNQENSIILTILKQPYLCESFATSSFISCGYEA
jgi:hypothetical protein